MTRIHITEGEYAIARAVAAQSASSWRNLELDDIRQHLYLWLLDNQHHLARWRDDEYGGGKLHVSLRREAARYCREQTSQQHLGPDVNYYTIPQIEALLPHVWDFSDWPQSADPASVVFDEALAMLADVSGAYYKLIPEDRDVLAYRYRDDMTIPQIAERLDLTVRQIERGIARALKNLHTRLGGEAPHTGHLTGHRDPLSKGRTHADRYALYPTDD